MYNEDEIEQMKLLKQIEKNARRPLLAAGLTPE
ncbi:hypothetical protein PR003_g34783 [Phytophthora rubi]|uniref:Uncharacterized protein n=1 Tax=Phytophthora rubi TaxID=129364 RepID=A0A6A4APR2_9STRA|nr:hypothetical protein PR002_g32950 [Phytophthora rubi]KAE9259448.1 hypothetical protein PR003_g34783 [Phytophthora rubi]